MGKVPKRAYRPLFLGEWMEMLGKEPPDVAKAVGVTPSYIRNMIGDRRPNPSAHVLVAISEYLGITVNDLYRSPPSESALSVLSDLSPSARQTLINQKSRR